LTRRLLITGVIAGAMLIPVVGSSAMTTPKLTGTVGPGFTILLKNANGQKVRTLEAGKYTFVVNDKSAIHNFVVEKSGGKFERAITTVAAKGTKTVTLTLTRGKWEVVCEPHEDAMHQDFTVT
jgi:hypothetical protein